MANVWNKYANTAARKHGKPGREVGRKASPSICTAMSRSRALPRSSRRI